MKLVHLVEVVVILSFPAAEEVISHFKGEVILPLILQEKHLFVISSEIVIEDINIPELGERLVNMNAVVFPELDLELRAEEDVFSCQLVIVLLANGQTFHCCVSTVDEGWAREIGHLETADHSARAKLTTEELLFVDLITNIIEPFLNEEYLKNLGHLIKYEISFLEIPDLQVTQQFDHELAVVGVFKWIVRKRKGALRVIFRSRNLKLSLSITREKQLVQLQLDV